MTSRKWYVYHIKTSGMGLDQGYVGISVNPKARWKAHKTRKCNPHLSNAIRKYSDQLIYCILGIYDTEEEARWQEYTLRPTKNIGWNVAQGGTKSPVLAMGGLSQETLDKIKASNVGRKHTQDTKDKISKGNKGKVRSEEYCLKASLLHSGHNSARAKFATIHLYADDSIFAERVVIREWCRQNKFGHSGLTKTTKSDLSQPSTKDNPCHYKGYYARYMS